MAQFMDWNPSTNQRLNSREDESVEVLKMIANQNPVAASGLKGAQKAAEEMSYEAIKSGAKDVNDVLADLVAKFGGATPMKSSVGKAQAGAVVGATADMDSMAVKTPAQEVSAPQTEVQEQPMSPEETQKQNMTQLQQMAMDVMTQKPKTSMWGVIGDILTMGTASKNLAAGDRKKLLDDIKKAQEILGEEPVQKKDVALKTLEFKLKASEEKNLKPEHLLNKFEPVANAYQTIVDSFDRVNSSAKDPSAAGDLALIFNYMKILDPGSTVREGEFATAQNSAGLPERLRAMYNSTINGQRLGDVQRNDFVKRAGMLFEAKEKQYQKSEKEFKRIAEKNGIDPEKVLRKVERTQPSIGESPFTAEQARAELERRKKQKGL